MHCIYRRLSLLSTVLILLTLAAECSAAEPLSVMADFDGGSVRVLDIDQTTRSISFMPGGNPERGWPCWWYFRVDGIAAGETITIRLQGSTAAIAEQKPLAASWAMPKQAAYSTDGKEWLQTEPGQQREEWMVYTVQPDSSSLFVAWGPPYTPDAALEFLRQVSSRSAHAELLELCRSREDRSVPMLHVREGQRAAEQRFGIWVQARQHAWESGSSWVAHGFVEWLVSDDPAAGWLRQHADVFIVPIMDVDNTATGNGGKNALPHDHNRDWSEAPHWNEVVAAQRRVGDLIEAGRMDVFLDLHNPAPGDPSFFYILPADLLQEPMVTLRNRLIELAYGRISRIRPLMPMSNRPKVTGASYHPLWKNISANWVSMHGNPETVSLCLETAWNSSSSNTGGYRAVGANLGAAVAEYLQERPLHD